MSASMLVEDHIAGQGRAARLPGVAAAVLQSYGVLQDRAARAVRRVGGAVGAALRPRAPARRPARTSPRP